MALKKLNIQTDGELFSHELAPYGGIFSIKEKIKMSGVGSNSIFYKSGLQNSEIDENIDNRPAFLSFEILKKGLLIRINKQQKLFCYAL